MKKEISNYIGDTVLRENIAEYECVWESRIEISKVIKNDGVYIVDYFVNRPDGEEIKRTGFEVEPLEIMEMINTKINNFIEEYKNTENE